MKDSARKAKSATPQVSNESLGISMDALANFLANLERAGLITVNREKLKLR